MVLPQRLVVGSHSHVERVELHLLLFVFVLFERLIERGLNSVDVMHKVSACVLYNLVGFLTIGLYLDL